MMLGIDIGMMMCYSVVQFDLLLISMVLFSFFGSVLKYFVISRMVQGSVKIMQVRINVRQLLKIFSVMMMLKQGISRVIGGMVCVLMMKILSVFLNWKEQWLKLQVVRIEMRIVSIVIMSVIRQLFRKNCIFIGLWKIV